MPTYIVLHEFTEQGIDNIEEFPDNIKNGREVLESLGGELKGLYLTFGQYDAVGIIELPDDETAAQFMLSIGQQGDASTETLKAFPLDEFDNIISGIPN